MALLLRLISPASAASARRPLSVRLQVREISAKILADRSFPAIAPAPAAPPPSLLQVLVSPLSSSLPPPTEGGGASFDFERDSEETLESLCERLEDLLQDASGMEEADVSLASGVLTAQLPGLGTYVINKQSPNRQIWLSSPVSGPARFDFDRGTCSWVYARTGENLHVLLDREIGQGLLKTEGAGFTECYLGGGEGEKE